MMKRQTAFEWSSFSSADGCTGLVRFIVWLNIFLQFLFPLAGAFTPAIVHAKHAVTASAGTPGATTQVYTLGRGESVRSVAQKYHLTVEELRKLNQFRTFAHGFSGLQAGDELDVPVATVSPQKTATTPDNAPDEQQQKMAGLASQAGSFLSNSPDGQAAQSLVTGMATGEASGRLQQILSRYGTARVQLGMDDSFSLKNSQFDLLLPLWERQNTLLFTQGGIHRTDDRTQSSLGLGLRYFADDWMAGGNTFLDYDLSRDHSRLGLGLEYGRDYLKLSANAYQRLSNWKDSPDVEDYQERPANGWDVRAEGWLPALPQLGGKIVYEQYYGDEVALSDKNDRQRDPHAVTVGVNYTPVPLVTLNAEQQQGSAGDNETRVGLALNYQLGIPWLHQIDPDGVAAMHTLTGSRYDLVERNNAIILEYRKQELIRLKTAALVTGSGGERKSLDVTVNSKYGVKRIDWSAAGLIAAGGKIIASSASRYDVLLPPWQSAAGAVNTYQVTGVAVDSKDNRSAPSDTQVTVTAAEISVAKSRFLPDSPLKSSPNASYLPADGKTQGTATLTLVNDQNQPVDVPLSDITLATDITVLPASGGLQAASKTLKASAPADATVSALARKSAGVYEVTVTAGTKAERVTLTPAVRKASLSAARFFIVRTAPDAGQSTFAASPKTLTADNTAVSTLTLMAKDASGNPLSGVAGSLSVAVSDSHGAAPAAGRVTVSSMTETATAGTYSATLKGTLAGTYTVKPLFTGSALGSLSDTVTLTAGTTPDAGQSSFSASPKLLAADGISASTLTLTVKDASGNPLTGVAGSLTAVARDSQGHTPAADEVSISGMTATATAGVYTATLTGTQAGSYKVVPQFSGSAIGSLGDTVVLSAVRTPDGAQSTFSAAPVSVTANNIATSTLTLEAKDSNGNAITGISASLTLSVKDSGGNTPPAGKVTVSGLSESATPGTYTATLKGGLAGTYTVKPLFSNSALGNLSAAVTLTAGTVPDGTQSTFSTSPKIIAADNTATSTLTFSAKDAGGNAITGTAASLTFAVKDSGGVTPAAGKVVVGTVSESATPGVYTATLKGTLAGAYTVKPQFSGSAVGTLSDSVVLTAGTTPDGTQSTFSAAPVSVAANNIAVSTLTLVAKDAYGNAVKGIAAGLSLDVKDKTSGTVPSAAQVTVGSVTESATPGTYTATLKGVLAGTYTMKPQFSGGAIGSLSAAVTLTAGTVPDGTRSAFSSSPKIIAADNTATSTLTLTAKDAGGNAVSGIATSLAFVVKDSGGAAPTATQVAVGTITESSTVPGTYTATLKGTLAGAYTVKPQFSGSAVGALSDSVVLTAGTVPDGSTSAFSAAPVSVAADNIAVSTLTLVAKDAYGNAVKGIAAGLSLDVKDSGGTTPSAAQVTVGSVSETATPGTYTATLKGTLADVYTVKPQFSGGALGSLSAAVTLTAGTVPDGTQSTFSAAPVSITADNTAVSTLTFTAKDAGGNAVSGIKGSLAFIVKDSSDATPAAGKVTVGSISEAGTSGVYTATLKGTLAGTYTVKPQFSNSALGSLSASVTLTAGRVPDGSQSEFSTTPKTIAANGTAISLLTLKVKDANGNAIGGLSGLTLAVKDSLGVAPGAGQVEVSDLTETTVPGTWVATLKGTRAEKWTVTPQVNSNPIGALSDTVTLTAGGTPDGSLSTFSVSPASIAADNTAVSTLTVVLKDAGGNAMGGQTGLGISVKDSQNSTPSSAQVVVSSVTETTTAGTYTATLKGTLAGTYTVKPQFNSDDIGALSDTVTLTAGTTPDGGKSLFSASPKAVAADDSATSTLTLQVKDAYGNAIGGVSGLSLSIKDSLNQTPAAGKVTLSALTETVTPGTWTATLKGQQADTYTVTPQLNASALGTLSDTVTLTAGTVPDATQSAFAVLPHSIIANNTATSTVLFTAKDTFGNPVRGLSGLSVGVKGSAGTAPAAGKVTVSSLSETATPGVYSATLKGILADVYTLTPLLNSSPVAR